MTRRHWHLSVNMAGYLPDGDPEVYTSKESAVAAAMWHKEQFQEQGDTNKNGNWVPFYRVFGNARKGGYMVERNGDNTYALPYYINVDGPCTDASCADWFNEDGEVIDY
jgi:hypothetical protein